MTVNVTIRGTISGTESSFIVSAPGETLEWVQAREEAIFRPLLLWDLVSVEQVNDRTNLLPPRDSPVWPSERGRNATVQ